MLEPFGTEKTAFQKIAETLCVLLAFSISFGICLTSGRADDGRDDPMVEPSYNDYMSEEYEEEYEKFEDIKEFDEYTELASRIPTASEILYLSAALAACPNGLQTAGLDLLVLMRLEQELGMDKWGKGLLLGVFCIEASYRRETQKGGRIFGDYRGGVAMAHGPFQLWPVNRRYCGDSGGQAHDLIWAGRCWDKMVKRALPRAEKKCPGSAFRTAEAAISNVARYQWSCTLGSKHWKVVEKINEIYERKLAGEI